MTTFLSSIFLCATTITNCADLTTVYNTRPKERVSFDVTARVLAAPGEYGNAAAIKDASGRALMMPDDNILTAESVHRGDLIHVRGRICAPTNSSTFARAETLELLSHEELSEVAVLTPSDLAGEDFRGAPIIIEGIVRNVFHDEIDRRFAFYVLFDGFNHVYLARRKERMTPEETENLIGARIRARGFLEDYDNKSTLRKIRNMVIVNNEDGIEIVSHPPWWTPLRLSLAFGSLLILLALFCLREHLRKRVAQSRIAERTRLAVELHDSLAQTLTGVAMELDTAEALRGDPEEAARHLNNGRRALKSCRDELRNCLWDLRNNALDEPDFTQAIRATLKAHADAANVSVRFNVRRELVDEQVAHAILRVVRELVLNALRHGHATKVRVAGTIKDGKLLCFLVTDDGCGFDPKKRPGVLEGHYGLDGIVERLKMLKGSISFDSSPGNGSRISCTIPTHRHHAESNVL